VGQCRGSQRAQQRTGCQRRLALRARRRWRGRCARPGARGSRVTASRYALGAEGGGAARPGAYMCFPRNCARCLLGGGRDVEDVVRCAVAAREARCKACFELLRPAEGEGGVAHREVLTVPPPPPRSSGAPVRWPMARGRRASGVAAAPTIGRSKVSRRRRAGHAPPARRGRRVRVPCAFKRPRQSITFGGWVWWWQSLTELPQAGFP